jgi:hypothetical protein
MAIERRKAFHDCTGHVTCTKDNDSPITVVVGLKKEFYAAAAGHADVALEVPFQKDAGCRGQGAGGRRIARTNRQCLGSQHFLRVLNCFMLNFSTTDCTHDKASGTNKHLAAGILGRAAGGLHHCDADERGAALRELSEAFDESVRGGHVWFGVGGALARPADCLL